MPDTTHAQPVPRGRRSPKAPSGSARPAVPSAAADRLALLVEASKALNSTLELETLCDTILSMSCKHTGADRGTLFLRDTNNGQLSSLLAQGLGHGEIRISEGRGVAGWVARSGQSVNLSEAHQDERFEPYFDDLFDYETHSLVAVPIKDRTGGTIGVLELLNKAEGAFTQDDVDFLESISVHAAIALQNAQWHRTVLEHERLERDLSVARSIQEGLLPDSVPELKGLEIGVRHEISFLVGGDFYDFLPAGRGCQVFVVADVESKGAASALVVSNLQATLRTLVRHVHSLEGIMFHLNESIHQNTRGERYATLFLGLLDVASRGLHYINAGHVPPVLVRRHGEHPLEAGGTVLGLFPQQRYKRGFARMEPGDVMVACTDGITETNGVNEEEYGMTRLVGSIRDHRQLPASALVDAVLGDVAAFSTDGAPRDDRVLMVVKASD